MGTEIINQMMEAFTKKDVSLAVKYFIVESSDELTNEVRSRLDALSDDEILGIQNYLYNLLNLCYGGKLFEGADATEHQLVQALDEQQLFLLKETVIYFLGRIKFAPSIEILKRAYFLEQNKHLQLNITFSSLFTFDEEIEGDFVNRITYGNEYDQMIRSWTMAYFKNAQNPYQYVDQKGDDWQQAKMPRIKRLAINDEANSKFNKAMAFRLMDFVVIDLFLENRETESLSAQEKEIVENAYIEYPKFSQEKQMKLQRLKTKILNK